MRVGNIGAARRESIAKRIQEFGLKAFKEAVDKAARSEFLNRQANGAPFDFDWFIRYDNFRKTLEGSFTGLHRRKQMPHDDGMPTREDIQNDRGLVDYD